MSVRPNIRYLQEKLGYQFNDLDKLEMALTHRSAHNQHNERMEFLGDAILGSIISQQLYQQFPQADEGQLSRLRSFLVREKALYEIAQLLSLGDFLNLGSGELKSGGFRRASILSDALEAIIGAIYLDSDFSQAQACVLNIYSEKLANLSLDMAQKDPKTQLQEWLQARNLEIPDYQVTHSEGKEHAKTYWVECKVEYKNMQTKAKGSSRRKAEQNAADLILGKIIND